MARVLVTAFGPFAEWTVNSSAEAVARLPSQPDLTTRILPVDHEEAETALEAAVAETRPAFLLMTGLAAGATLRLELLARRPAHRDDGPAERRGLWPWAAALDAMRATGAPAALSRDAGRYVCETTYWTGAGMVGRGPARAAFLHVPPLSPEWPAERIAAALSACLAAGTATR